VLKDDGQPYTVFTPFSLKWRKFALPQATADSAPSQLTTPEGIHTEAIPSTPALPSDTLFIPGESEARDRLTAFVAGEAAAIFDYATGRDRLDERGTSRLSPYFRFGMLSARRAVASAQAAIDSAPTESTRQGANTWLNELIWREFYINILYHFPYVWGESFRTELRDVQWENDKTMFAAWCQGHTGYPVVDAAMRQLQQTGWMHNRARMIVASFLVKDLLIDWRWGEKWFMQQLIDGDPAANNGGWQWTAGTGTDAAPYFRIFNPILQSKKHDPHGRFIRRWVSELRDVPDRYIHEPWRMPRESQQRAQCVINEDYPAPIVEHQEMRKRALALYKEASQRDSAS
jgi:deoxyribodipyrimidine photo-lyase